MRGSLKHYLEQSYIQNLFAIHRREFRQNAILLFGDPRSGSTWLAEVLNQLPDSGIIDEPLNLNKTYELNESNFAWRQAIPEEASWELPERYFDQLLNGIKIRRNLINSKSFLFTGIKTPIYKIIRGKLLSDWLVHNFIFERKPIFLVRHPLAVVSSMKLHPSWQYDYKGFNVPQTPYNEIYIKHEKFFSSLKSNLELLLALWCISNRRLNNIVEVEKKYIVIFYENLLRDPEMELQKIMRAWDLNFTFSSFSKPSTSSLEGEKISRERQPSKWKNQLSIEEIKSFQRILDYFGIEFYKSDSLYPNV